MTDMIGIAALDPKDYGLAAKLLGDFALSVDEIESEGQRTAVGNVVHPGLVEALAAAVDKVNADSPTGPLLERFMVYPEPTTGMP